jgi:polar amino acid transport system substrate-binding protein
MKIKFYFIILLVSFSSLADNKITYFIADKSSSPFQISTKNNKKVGIVTEVIRSIEKHNIHFSHNVLPFKRMIKHMEYPKVKWITYGSAAWPGQQSLSLSKTSIMTVKHSFLTLKSNQYNQIDDLFGNSLVLIHGFDYPGLTAYIEQDKFNIIYVKDHAAAIKIIAMGRAIAFPEMNVRLNYHLKKMNLPRDDFNFHYIGNIIVDYDINLCFSENFPTNLKTKIEYILVEMKNDGSLEDIINAY